MAKTKDSDFLKRATRLGLEQMAAEVQTILGNEIPEALRITQEEMLEQIRKHLEDHA